MQLRHFIYPGFIVVCLLVFWKTIHYGYATDYLGWLNRYRDGSWSDVLTCFGYPGLHQFFHFVNYGLYIIFGSNIAGLGIVFILGHASTSYLIYRTFRLILNEVDDDKGGLISIFASMLFALSPYVIEVLTWDACFHYIICTALTFGSLNFLIQYLQTDRVKLLILHFVLWTLALFTIELGLVAPGIFVLYGLLYFTSITNFTQAIKKIGLLVPIYIAIQAAYFLLTKYTIGFWVGHYGASKHLNLDPTLLASTLNKYIVKIGLFAHHWTFSYKEQLYTYFDKPIVTWIFFIALIGSIAFFYFYKKPNIATYVPLVGFLSFCIGVLPILNLYFLWVVPYENDRYTYFASPHFLLMITALLVYIFKKLYWVLYLLIVTISGILLGRMTEVAHQAGNVTNELVKNFNFYDEKELVFLCIPENLKGAYLFRDYSDSSITFIETLDWLKEGKTYKGITHNISQFNLTSQRDSVTVQRVDSTQLRVNIASWGTWFWRKGMGLSSFENDQFKVTTGDLHFTLIDKFPEKKRLFLYTVGGEWRSVRLGE